GVTDLPRPTLRGRDSRRMQRDVGGILLLAAEAATRGRLDHPDSGLIAGEGVLEGAEHVVRALHRALHHEHLVLEPGDHPLGLEVDMLLRAGLVGPGDDDRRLRQRPIHVALLNLQALEAVVAAAWDLVGARRYADVEPRRLV